MVTLQSLIGNPDAFPILRHWDFFNHAGVSPLPRVSADAMRRYAEQAETTVYLHSQWYQDMDKLREVCAALINAHPDEVALVKNTSEGISIVANGIDWRAGDVIVTTAVEYPANIYPWMELQRSRGVKLVLVPEEVDEHGANAVPLERLIEAASDPKCRMVTVSHVQFASQQRLDVERLGRFCRQSGKLFCVDAIQSIGIIPVDVRSMNIDFLAADGHKWMMGPEGAGFFYCRRELIEQARPGLVGWANVVNALDYGSYDYTLRPDAQRFECGSNNVAGFLALKASLELLRSIGIENVSARMKLLTDHLARGVAGKGYRVLSPRAHDQWGGGVCFASDRHEHKPIVVNLRKQHRTEIALREGRLRASPHFYNTVEQLDRLVGNLPSH